MVITIVCREAWRGKLTTEAEPIAVVHRSKRISQSTSTYPLALLGILYVLFYCILITMLRYSCITHNREVTKRLREGE